MHVLKCMLLSFLLIKLLSLLLNLKMIFAQIVVESLLVVAQFPFDSTAEAVLLTLVLKKLIYVNIIQ